MLKPVIYGLVHNDAVADLISDLTVKNNGFDRVKELLEKILGEYGGIDLKLFRIEGHQKTIWQEITDIQKARNLVVHRAEIADSKICDLAEQVATMILGNFLPSVLSGFGLSIKEGFVIGYA